LIERAPDEASRSRLAGMLLSPPAEGTDEMIRMAQDCLTAIRDAARKKHLDQIMSEMKSCSDPEKKKILMSEWQKLNAKG
jgi:hypothetical protein